MDMAEIERELALLESRFPYVEGETKRTWERQWILNCAPKNAVGAEIGVFRGRFSEVIMTNLTPNTLYLIDPWQKLGEFFWDQPYFNNGKLQTKTALHEVMLRAAKFPATNTVIIEDFFPACESRISMPLDFVYIDASHQHEETLAQLNAAARLIRPGGIIMGDDFVPDKTHANYGVFLAVNEFIKTMPFDFVAAGPSRQWCLRHEEAR